MNTINNRKHTAGPWNYSPDENGTIIRNSNGEDVCEVSLPMKRERGYDACAEEQLVNAALIASAPELLEACKEGLSMLKYGQCSHGTGNSGKEVLLKIIEQAIDKAEGR